MCNLIKRIFWHRPRGFSVFFLLINDSDSNSQQELSKKIQCEGKKLLNQQKKIFLNRIPVNWTFYGQCTFWHSIWFFDFVTLCRVWLFIIILFLNWLMYPLQYSNIWWDLSLIMIMNYKLYLGILQVLFWE